MWWYSSKSDKFWHSFPSDFQVQVEYQEILFIMNIISYLANIKWVYVKDLHNLLMRDQQIGKAGPEWIGENTSIYYGRKTGFFN